MTGHDIRNVMITHYSTSILRERDNPDPVEGFRRYTGFQRVLMALLAVTRRRM